jgi:hypothetical protein
MMMSFTGVELWSGWDGMGEKAAAGQGLATLMLERLGYASSQNLFQKLFRSSPENPTTDPSLKLHH